MAANPKPAPRQVKPLAIPEAQAILAERLAILCGHGLWDKVRAVISEAETEWHTKRLDAITLDSPLCMLPGLDHRSICALENVGVLTIRQFRAYHVGGELLKMPQVGQVTVDKTLEAIGQLPHELI